MGDRIIRLPEDERLFLERLLAQYAKEMQRAKEAATTETENHLYDERHRKTLRVLAKIEQ
jgi:hypothetical protein